uniref:MIR domain-containing protein n=1 Tax=Kalanchoe fedtschenkoi TaxID=63787 RepID=A0A7N0TCS5_KALFE
MAASLSAVGSYLLLCLSVVGIQQGSPASASEAVELVPCRLGHHIDPGKESRVTYGSVIKLKHEKTKFRLHSHEVPYGSGSGQQSVTGFPNVDDANSYWIVRPEPGTSATQGDPIKSGTIIRLQQATTRKWLHSHLHASPITGNLELFWRRRRVGHRDYWRLTIEGRGKTWRKDQRVRLQHVDTGGYLHSHNKKYQRIVGGQQEVCGVGEKRAENIWLAAEGVYLQASGSK